jgi:two-component system sensor histidine kinase ChvG
MTTAPKIDVRDLDSVRQAAGQAESVVLGDDWIAPSADEADRQKRRARRGVLQLYSSPLARKIITFNLLGLIVLVAGVFYLSPSRDNLAFQRGAALVNEAELVADIFEAQLPADAPVSLVTGDGIDPQGTLDGLDLRSGVDVHLFDRQGVLVSSRSDPAAQDAPVPGLELEGHGTLITDFLNGAFDWVALVLRGGGPAATPDDPVRDVARSVAQTFETGTRLQTRQDADGRAFFTVSTPVMQGDRAVGAVAVVSPPGELKALVSRDREQLLQMFVIGVIVSIALSLVLASTIANPLSDLAEAAELGRDKNARKVAPERIRIPDLTGRPDEIGRLSGALRGMVTALTQRIEGNEQFAADVAHEIKNPLASMRSAVGTLRVAKRDDQRERMLEVLEHDVRRLDRLVSDISNASRLDTELVKEKEETFDLLRNLANLTAFFATEADRKGVDFITDLPGEPIPMVGLEGRLAQVFVNLITNAISFCDEGDAIRVWTRKRENRVLVVVEDTGPGLPDGALSKIFTRFYSERPEGQFGNNSGLGLAISKQIVEAHGGVIWAENIRPTDADIGSDPLGARFVVGLPV